MLLLSPSVLAVGVITDRLYIEWAKKWTTSKLITTVYDDVERFFIYQDVQLLSRVKEIF